MVEHDTITGTDTCQTKQISLTLEQDTTNSAMQTGAVVTAAATSAV